MQTLHMKVLEMSDIAYNFLVSGDAMAWEGRGWETESEPTLKYPQYNGDRIDIAFVGSVEKRTRFPMLLNKAMELIHFGIKHKLIKDSFKLIDSEASLERKSMGFGKAHETTFNVHEEPTEKQREEEYNRWRKVHVTEVGGNDFTGMKEGNVKDSHP